MPRKPKPLGKVETTARGFEIIKFVDRNGRECSLQVSSIADYETPGTSAVWIGCVDADPKRLIPGQGWKKVFFPSDTLFHTRAELDREQVAALIVHLKSWLKTGSFKANRKGSA